jgi:hypothetical protein
MSLDLARNCETPERANDSTSAVKIRMALREAEYSELDVTFVRASTEGSRLSGFVSSWLADPRNHHEGKFLLMGRPGLDSEELRNHPDFKFTELSDSVKIKDFSEFLLLGKEVLIVDMRGEISIHRIKQHVDLGVRAVKALRRIGLLEAQRAI